MGAKVSLLENAVKHDLTNKYKPFDLKHQQLQPIGPKILRLSTVKTSYSINQSSRFFNLPYDGKCGIFDSIDECKLGNELSRSSCRLSKVLSKLGEEEIF